MARDWADELVITFDKEGGPLRVDTTIKAWAARCRRVGMKEFGQPEARPYSRFHGDIKQLSFRKLRAPRPPSAAQQKARATFASRRPPNSSLKQV